VPTYHLAAVWIEMVFADVGQIGCQGEYVLQWEAVILHLILAVLQIPCWPLAPVVLRQIVVHSRCWHQLVPAL
jgi:hypothetical protein